MTPKLPNYAVTYDEETYDRVCAELDAARIELDRWRGAAEGHDRADRLADIAVKLATRQRDAARAEAERLRAAVEEVLEFAQHGGDPWRAIIGLRQVFDAVTTDITHG